MNFLETLFSFAEVLWPFRMIEEGERGVYYVFGRALRRTVGAGVYPVIPWFIDVEPVSVLPRVLSTPLLDLSLDDQKMVSFTLTAIVRVTDPRSALVCIDDYEESVGELIASMAADKIAEVDVARLVPEKRKRLLFDLKRWVNDDTEKYGVEVMTLRFTNFIINARTYRLLHDSSQLSMGM